MIFVKWHDVNKSVTKRNFVEINEILEIASTWTQRILFVRVIWLKIVIMTLDSKTLNHLFSYEDALFL